MSRTEAEQPGRSEGRAKPDAERRLPVGLTLNQTKPGPNKNQSPEQPHAASRLQTGAPREYETNIESRKKARIAAIKK